MTSGRRLSVTFVPCAPRRGRLVPVLAFCAVASVLVPASVRAAARVDSLDARQQAYLCSSLQKEPAVAACRRALELGLSRERAATVHLLLALHLAGLNRWPEVVESYRALVKLRPSDAEAQWRLGDALLFGLSAPREALAPLREAVRLKPEHAGARGSLGVGLAMVGSFAEAIAQFDEAVRLEPQYFANRPAARRVYEAARRGEPWQR